MLGCEHLTVKYGATKALNDVSVEISDASGVTGLIGPNGSGKTTLIETLLGLRKITEGKVKNSGVRVAYCQDTPRFETGITAEEVVWSSALQAGFSSVKKEDVTEVLSIVGLRDARKRRASKFSRGMKQRLGLAASLILSPNVLFLDEPTSALDPFGRQELLHLIVSLADNARIVVSTHLLDDLQEIADDIIVMNRGNVAFVGSKDQFLSGHTDTWEILVSSSEKLEIVGGHLKKRGFSYKKLTGNEYGLCVDACEMPLVLSSLSEELIRSVSCMRPSGALMYRAFESLVGENHA